MGGTLMLHLEMGVGERCQEWPSPRSFKFYICRGLLTSCVKATAPWRSSLPLRNSGGRLWRRNWRLSGRGRTLMPGCLAPAHSVCWCLPPGLWASTRAVPRSPSWLLHALRSWVCAFSATTLCLRTWRGAVSSTFDVLLPLRQGSCRA